jgi:hypothetical protein
MNEDPSVRPSMIPDRSETDVVSLLNKMQQQLLFLEKKIDLLISQSQGRPSGEKTSQDRPFRKRPFSKPFRSFDHPQHHGKGEHGHNPRERDAAKGHFYERRPGEKSRGPSSKKKPFSFKRKDRE